MLQYTTLLRVGRRWGCRAVGSHVAPLSAATSMPPSGVGVRHFSTRRSSPSPQTKKPTTRTTTGSDPSRSTSVAKKSSPGAVVSYFRKWRGDPTTALPDRPPVLQSLVSGSICFLGVAALSSAHFGVLHDVGCGCCSALRLLRCSSVWLRAPQALAHG